MNFSSEWAKSELQFMKEHRLSSNPKEYLTADPIDVIKQAANNTKEKLEAATTALQAREILLTEFNRLVTNKSI